MYHLYADFEHGAAILISLALMLTSGFLVSRLTNILHLPKVSGYIIAGILIGPSFLQVVSPETLMHMGFVNDIALAFIAFNVGSFFTKTTLQENSKGIFILTLFESLLPGLLVSLIMHFVFKLDLDFSLVLGAIATATAPASTTMTINQYKAKGSFVNTLLQVVALDDAVCLFAFSIAAAYVNSSIEGTFQASFIIWPIIFNAGGIVLGAVAGFLLSKLITPQRSRDNRLIITTAILLAISGLCSIFDVSPLLSCMVFGSVYLNLSGDKKMFKQMTRFSPPIMSVFFIVSGMNLDISLLNAAGIVGLCYFIVRIIGKYLGSYSGAACTGMSPAIRNYLGLALVPQAGVAIGLAFLGQRILPPKQGSLLVTIILSSSVLYELIGPVCAKTALFLSGSIQKDKQLAPVKQEYTTSPKQRKNKQTTARLPDKDIPARPH